MTVVSTIYLDANATTPMAPSVVEAMTNVMRDVPGNPSSLHGPGIEAATALERARRSVARCLGADVASESIVFTGSGTEANNLAVRGAALAWLEAHGGRRSDPPPRVLTFAHEHPAVLEAARELEKRHGFEVKLLPVDANGVARLDHLHAALTDKTWGPPVLVALMAANNETGALQPIGEAAGMCRLHGVLFHVDATQVMGRTVFHPAAIGADMAAFSAHKFHGPKGVGALYVSPRLTLAPLMRGGGQEHGLRGGTENVAGAVGMATALLYCQAHDAEAMRREADRQCMIRERLWTSISSGHPSTIRHSLQGDKCLPNTLHLSLPGANAHELVVELGVAGLACSAGSACATAAGAGSAKPSHVLMAMGMPCEVAASAIRLSLCRFTTDTEIAQAANTFNTVASAHLQSRGRC